MSPATVSPRPAPTRICGGIVQPQPARGMSASAARPPASRITPHAMPCTPPSDRGRRRPTAIAVSGMTVTTTPAAAGDIPHPSTRRSTTRKSAATRPPATRSSAAFAVIDGRPGGSRHGPSAHSARREQQHQRERHLREEDRLPAEQLREDSSGGRPERGAEHARGNPGAERRLVAPLRLREEIECRRDEQRRAERLDAPGAHEHLERGREPARQRRHGEDDDTHDERLARSPPRDVRSRHGDDREHEVERGEHPRDGRDRDVELPEDLGERERDDGRIGEREPDAESEQRRAHGASLGPGLRLRPCDVRAGSEPPSRPRWPHARSRQPQPR